MKTNFKLLTLVVAVASYQAGLIAGTMMVPPVIPPASFEKTQLQNDADYAKMTALQAAVVAGDLSKVKALLDAGVKIDETVNRYSALMLAIRHGHLPITDLLLRYNAPITADEIEKVTVESKDTQLRDLCIQRVLASYPQLRQKTGLGVRNTPHVEENVLAIHTGA